MQSRMIGREDELHQLQTLFQSTHTSHTPALVTVLGESGVGKSRLVREYAAWVQAQPERTFLFRGRVDGPVGQQPYGLFRDLFARHFGITADDAPMLARRKLEQGIVQVLGVAGVLKSHFIGQLLGFNFNDSLHLRGIQRDSRQLHDRAFFYTLQFFQTVADPSMSRESRKSAVGPVVLMLDNVHWADDGSLDLLEYMAREAQGISLLLLAIARPELLRRRPTWGDGASRAIRIALEPLTPVASAELVGALLSGLPEVPASLRGLLVERAGGNPSYVEELIRMLQQAQVLLPVGEANGWQLDLERFNTLSLPETLGDIFQVRLSHLSPNERITLQQAAVVGRLFWDGALAAAAEAWEPGSHQRIDFHGILPTLEAQGFILLRSSSSLPGNREYLFRQSLLQDAAYRQIPEGIRTRAHRLVAEWMIRITSDRLDGYSGLIGDHLQRAGAGGEAIRWYAQAGEVARDAHVPGEAITYFERAISLLSPDEAGDAQRLVLAEALAKLLQYQVRYTDALTHYRVMMSAAERLDDLGAQVRACAAMATVEGHLGAAQQALGHAEQAVMLAQRLVGSPGAPPTAPIDLARALLVKGWATWSLGYGPQALAIGGQALALSETQEATDVIAHCLDFMGQIHMVQARHAEAESLMHQALVNFRAINDQRMVGTVLFNLGVNARFSGDYLAALIQFREALGVAREINDRDMQLWMLQHRGAALVGTGNYSEAEALLREFIASQEAYLLLLSETFYFLAEACLAQGKGREALMAAQQALRLAQERSQQDHEARAWRVLGKILARTFDEPLIVTASDLLAPLPAPDATSCFAQSADLFAMRGMQADRARTLRAWSLAVLDAGNLDEAETLWREARDIFLSLDLPAEITRTPPSPSRLESRVGYL